MIAGRTDNRIAATPALLRPLAATEATNPAIRPVRAEAVAPYRRRSNQRRRAPLNRPRAHVQSLRP